MADALVSVVLERLSSIVSEKVGQKVRLFVGVKNEVEKLTSSFRAIQAVFADAEERQLKDQFVKHWLDQLKDVSYDMDDVLDEWDTAIAKLQSKNTRKVCSFMIFSCFHFREVGLRHRVAYKIKELNERIDDIVVEKNRFHFKLLEAGIKQLEHHETASVIDVKEVKGREKDKVRVIKTLLSESSQGPALRTISLVGMGGIGKTTLAKLVFNDHVVKTHFNRRIWVCVSDPFDETRIAKEILEARIRSTQNLKKLETLLEKIQQSFRENKFLLVLDDVWNEDSTKWEQLRNSLKCGLPGSRILVTTRNRNVAKCMGSSPTDILELGLLPPEELKCEGLPLAAKTLGSLLRFKRSRAEWESVLHSHVWEIKEAESNLLAPLWLSYHDLPSENKEMEVMGRECFEALAARSFFQDFKKEEGDDSIYACKMHDMVHDFAQFLTKNESFNVEIDGAAESKIDSFSRDARHSMVVLRKYKTYSFPETIHSLKKLRSLIVDGYPSSMNATLPNLIANLSCLRTLRLSRCGIEEVPSNIGKLIHLRHVDLSGNLIRELPEEMCELYNMLTLDVSDCEKLERLPDNMEKLVKLRHLSVGRWFVKMRGVEGLSSLRELDEFHVSGSGEVSNFGDLRNLNHLQGSLKIRWLGDVKDPDEVKKALLKSKEHLTCLRLWFESRIDKGTIHDDEVLEVLEPPPNLEFLEIRYYRGIDPVFSSCINKLRVVELSEWRKIENLPHLGKLPSLEELTISWMECVKKMGDEFLGLEVDREDDEDSEISIGEMTSPSPSNITTAFPKLKGLTFSDMRKWEEWEGGEGGRWRRGNEYKTNIFISIIMPSLRSLLILKCPKLKALPDYVLQSTTIEKLLIKSSSILEEQFKAGGEGWPNDSHIPSITII
ncbi:putative disease resistance protein RGA3 [Populus nigra]|uniref:putative disease resistance protein RGA3 n=1 Tax=Populus nigra TaxID=3691 RepID=UPI002B26831A|nr:putative disease resistance protein RGA3 [Populus nigra]